MLIVIDEAKRQEMEDERREAEGNWLPQIRILHFVTKKSLRVYFYSSVSIIFQSKQTCP